jgi:hypothetical protein
MSTAWQASWHPARPALDGVLAGTWTVHAGRADALAARVLPVGSTCLALQRDGAVLRSGDHDWRPWSMASVSGPGHGPFDFDLNPGGSFLIVQLRPAGAMQVLGVPMSSLADRSERLDDVVDRDADRLGDLVLAECDDRRSVQVVERWLLDRVHRRDDRFPATDAVVGTVTRPCRPGPCSRPRDQRRALAAAPGADHDGEGRHHAKALRPHHPLPTRGAAGTAATGPGVE